MWQSKFNFKNVSPCPLPNTVPNTMQFSEEFVENLLNEGEKIACDETLETFNKTEVPAFYDEKLFKRGRHFFYENMFSIMNCQVLSTICIVALPQSLKVFKMTNKTTSNLKSYRRYLATLLHLILWYDMDFRPGSRFLTSITSVKKKHNAASNQSIKKLNCRVNQMDMALTQVAMIAFVVIRGALMGIDNPKEEDLQGFIHVWRVIGSLLGMEDRFNICRESVKETKEICEIVLNKIITPLFENPDKETAEMLGYLINGVSPVYPILEYDFCMTLLHMVLENQPNYKKLKSKNCKDISLSVKMKIRFLLGTLKCMKFRIARLCAQYLFKFLLWMTTTFPILAYIKYGVNDGYVDFYETLDSKKYS